MAEGTLAQAIDIYEQLQLIRYTTVSACVWLLYDMILTSRLEVKHIWRRDFALPQALYCFIRYYALAYISYLSILSLTPGLSVRVCEAFTKIEAFGMPIFALFVNGLLVLRLHAIYHSRKVTRLLAVLLIVQTTFVFVITALSALPVYALPTPPELRRWPGCFMLKTTRSPRFTAVAWVVALVVDSIFFAMTLYKMWELHARGIRASGLLTVFVRDGALFFGIIFIIELANTLINALEPIGPLIGAGTPWIIAGWGIAASRLVLSLREYSNKGLESTTLRGPTRAPGIESSTPAVYTEQWMELYERT